VGTAHAPPPTNNPPATTLTPTQVAQIADLVTQANMHYAAAYAALKIGDFTTFANEMAKVGQILQQLQAITGTTPTPGGATPTPSPGARASPSPEGDEEDREQRPVSDHALDLGVESEVLRVLRVHLHGDYEPPALRKLIDERGRHLPGGARHQDAGVRSLCRPAHAAVGDRNLDVVETQALQR